MALWAAPKWQTRDKVIGTAAALLVPILLGLLLGIGIATGGVAVRSGTVLAAVITLTVTAATRVYLVRAGRRTARLTAAPRSRPLTRTAATSRSGQGPTCSSGPTTRGGTRRGPPA
ncbi:hypothetical protein ACFY1C_33970 [Streptomyces sp. NPDC001279]|uniref:hypothetical protein n=1 Tax=Streptomyces sp. NPDC001279 TaxID=3364556 RepID=UPI0036CA8450